MGGERLQSVLWLGFKELASLGRDAAMVGLIIYAFTYAVYGPAKGAQMELRNASVAIVDEDRSELSRRIADALLQPFFKRPEAIGASEVDRVMDAGRYTFVIDIPPRFESDLEAGRNPTIQLNVDATAMSQAGHGAAYIQSIIAQEIQRVAPAPSDTAPSVRLVTRAKFNPNLIETWFLGVSQIINNITMLAIILSGAAVVREREHGTIEHLLVMPLGPSDIMLAKIWSSALVIIIVSTISLLVVVQGMLGVPVAGSIPLFMASTGVYMFSVSSLGILLATVARSMPQFGLLAIPVFLMLNILSGGQTPLDSMPQWLQNVMQFSPTTHFVSMSMAILYRGAGLSAVWPDFAAVAGMGLVFFVAALAGFRRTVTLAQT
ncbi:MAG TPA: ABC transporter permease [Burkholderiales bacterium]|nr:ABC transporter permease [Burkholderiales bacterium]